MGRAFDILKNHRFWVFDKKIGIKKPSCSRYLKNKKSKIKELPAPGN